MSRGQGHPQPQQDNDNSPAAQLEHQPESDYDDAPESSDTLREQVQALTQDQSQTQQLLQQLLSRLPLLSNSATTPQTATPSFPNIVQSTEQRTLESTIPSLSTSYKYLVKLPDP